MYGMKLNLSWKKENKSSASMKGKGNDTALPFLGMVEEFFYASLPLFQGLKCRNTFLRGAPITY